MNPAQLVRMANQIGTFFEPMPDRDQAIQDIASHLRRNWEARMLSSLRQHLAQHGDGELLEIVRAAVARL
jgi:formate dehydrogenase subunit delta